MITSINVKKFNEIQHPSITLKKTILSKLGIDKNFLNLKKQTHENLQLTI